MKNLLLILGFFLFSSLSSNSQNYSSPECIRWDPVNEKYLVSNVGGFILSVDPESMERSGFANAGLTAPKGMVVVDGVVYVTDLTEIEGFSLNDGAQVFHLEVAGSAFLNGLAADEDGNLYAADTDLGKVYKITISTKVVTELATSGLTGANGVLYDKPNNRLIVVFWRSNAPVSEISLESGVVSPLLNTPYSNLDGITQDNCGNFYFSSWGSNTVYVVNSEFTEDPEVFLSGLNGPADIFFDKNTQELWVPNFSSNSIKGTIAFLPCITPVPLLPEDGSEDQTSRNLEFSWTPINHVKSYRVELSLTPIFADIVLALASGEPTINIESLDVNTTYYWRVSGSDGGSYTDNSPVYTFKTEVSSSVNYLSNSQMVKIFPNPAQTKIGVAWEERGLKINRIEIINITGQEKWSKIIPLGSKTYEYIDIHDWPRGVYFVNSFLENSEVLHHKLIVH